MLDTRSSVNRNFAALRILGNEHGDDSSREELKTRVRKLILKEEDEGLLPPETAEQILQIFWPVG